MYNPHGAYQQPGWQPGANQSFHRNGPPPAKKVKNNPVITRYPPPPGYRGPAQPHGPPYQQQPAWAPQPQQFPFNQQAYPGYGPPQTWQQQPQFQQYPPTAYPDPNYFQQQPPAPFAPVPSAWPPSVSPPHGGPRPPQQRHHSTASLSGRSEHANSVSGYDDEDLEEDFYDECYFAVHPEEIDLKLSLGMIEWKAPLPTKRPLPSTFAEAELEALAPRKPLPTDDESISDYFIRSKRHEASLSVRQTEYWNEVKDDIIFREFPMICASILTMSELLAKYKDRPDPTWRSRVYSPTPDPETSVMDVDDEITPRPQQNPHSRRTSRSQQYHRSRSVSRSQDYMDEQSDVLGSLENMSHSRRHSRASSVASTSSHRASKPTPLMPIRDAAQEDILAALGVTGSPKVVYQTPGPAIGAPQPQRTSRHNSNASGNGRPPPPPPPPPPTQDRYRRTSNGSHHTAAGSDFGDPDATPRAKVHRSETRKRAYEDSDDSDAQKQQQRAFGDDEETPKPRRKQKRVDRSHKW